MQYHVNVNLEVHYVNVRHAILLALLVSHFGAPSGLDRL